MPTAALFRWYPLRLCPCESPLWGRRGPTRRWPLASDAVRCPCGQHEPRSRSGAPARPSRERLETTPTAGPSPEETATRAVGAPVTCRWYQQVGFGGVGNVQIVGAIHSTPAAPSIRTSACLTARVNSNPNANRSAHLNSETKPSSINLHPTLTYPYTLNPHTTTHTLTLNPILTRNTNA